MAQSNHLPVLPLPFLCAPQASTPDQTACTSTSPVPSQETCGLFSNLAASGQRARGWLVGVGELGGLARWSVSGHRRWQGNKLSHSCLPFQQSWLRAFPVGGQLAARGELELLDPPLGTHFHSDAAGPQERGSDKVSQAPLCFPALPGLSERAAAYVAPTRQHGSLRS